MVVGRDAVEARAQLLEDLSGNRIIAAALETMKNDRGYLMVFACRQQRLPVFFPRGIVTGLVQASP